MSISPSLRLAALTALGAAAAALASLVDAGAQVAWLSLGCIACLALADAATAGWREPTVVIRDAVVTAFLRRPFTLALEVVGRGVTAVAPAWPPELGESAGILPVRRGAAPARVAVTRTPLRRGSYALGPVWVWRESGLGLWRKREIVASPCRVRVLPDLRGPADDLLVRDGTAHSPNGGVGLLHSGGELLALRQFAAGDDPRLLDWKATARQAAPVVRDWARDRRRLLYVLVDAGRLMRAEHGGEAKLDAGLRALTRIAACAEARGDCVGALVYADRVLRRVPPLSGAAQAARLLRHVEDLAPLPVESDLAQAVPYVMAEPRRSLVFVITDVLDPEGAQALVRPVLALARRHVPIVVLLRDPHVDEALRAEINDEPAAYRRAAAELAGAERAAALARLHGQGFRLLDVSMRSVALDLERAYAAPRLARELAV